MSMKGTGIILHQEFRLSNAFELFLLDAQAQGFTDSTVDFYRGRFRLILRWCDGHGVTTLSRFTHTTIKQYLADLQRQGLSGHYVHGHARVIRAFCNFCVREELLPSSPFARVKMPRLPKKVLPAFSSQELRQILKACTAERDKTAVMFMLDSGVRASELCALNVGDVSGDAVTVHKGKGQKGRITYIGARTRKQLLRYFAVERGGQVEPTEPLFTSLRNDDRLTYSALSQVLQRLQARTGIEHCNAHTFRRTMAITSLRNGMNVYVLAKMLGHADIHVLKQYLDMVQDDVKSAAARHGVVDNLF